MYEKQGGGGGGERGGRGREVGERGEREKGGRGGEKEGEREKGGGNGSAVSGWSGVMLNKFYLTSVAVSRVKRQGMGAGYPAPVLIHTQYSRPGPVTVIIFPWETQETLRFGRSSR